MATLSISLTPNQDAKYQCNPDGASEGALVDVDGNPLPVETPDAGFALACRIVYTGGSQSTVVKLDADVNPANATYISDTVDISPAGAANLNAAVTGIPKIV